MDQMIQDQASSAPAPSTKRTRRARKRPAPHAVSPRLPHVWGYELAQIAPGLIDLVDAAYESPHYSDDDLRALHALELYSL